MFYLGCWICWHLLRWTDQNAKLLQVPWPWCLRFKFQPASHPLLLGQEEQGWLQPMGKGNATGNSMLFWKRRWILSIKLGQVFTTRSSPLSHLEILGAEKETFWGSGEKRRKEQRLVQHTETYRTPLLRNALQGSSCHGSAETNLTRIHEDADLIPGLTSVG